MKLLSDQLRQVLRARVNCSQTGIAADRVRMLRRFIVFSTSRSIRFGSALKHCADGHNAGRPQNRGSMLPNVACRRHIRCR